MWTAIIAAILAATLGGVGLGTTTHSNRKQDNIKENQIQNLVDQGMSRSDAEYLANQYMGTAFNFFDPSTWGKNHNFNTTAQAQDYQDYLNWKDQVGPMPEDVDIDAILRDSSNTIDKENAQINAIYDQILGRSNELFQDEMEANNQAYNDFANQTLSSQAQAQNMMQGSVRSELNRSQRNAISRGATAAMRLVSNINTQLGLQNQAAQNALNTSNILAQSLLNQRQAAASLRQDYTNNLNQDADRRAGLIQGSAERRTSYANARLNQANAIHDQKLDQWNNRLNSYGGTNPYVNTYRNQQIKNSTGRSSYGI